VSEHFSDLALVAAINDLARAIRGADCRRGTQTILDRIATTETRIMATLQDILNDVQDEATVVGSVEALLTQLSDLLKNAGTDPAALQAVKDLVDSNKARLSAAVVANTPAAPTP
jgi:predicted metal-dependent enzyme (double-stranded beta helix superfamily)